MKRFTDIGQFRDIIRTVKINHDYKGKDENGTPIYNHDRSYPTLTFKGTIKLHGTSSAIVLYADNTVKYQSRERELSLEHDNNGFMLAMLSKQQSINSFITKLFNDLECTRYIAIYGEFCGKGIQSGVAISQLPKMFVIFGLKIDDVYYDISDYHWLPEVEKEMNENGIYLITQFENYTIDIDFNKPEMVQNRLGELTLGVEKQCPVGKYFGVEGVGEGIVWRYINNDKYYIFKVKGEKHQSSKVKTLAPVDIEEIENINKFIEYAVTENRLKQGIDKMVELGHPLETESTGEYLRWIFNDIIKEEKDTIVKNNINIKKIGSAISNKARVYWLNYLNNNV